MNATPSPFVRNIYCIGRNYAEHAKEMGHVPAEDEPVVFTKPSVSYRGTGAVLKWPASLGRVDHECELVLRLGGQGALEAVAVGIDVTARDLQARLKKKGMPWALAKGRDGFAPVSPWVPIARAGRIEELGFALRVNGAQRQRGLARDMIFPVPRILGFLATAFELGEGDLVFTGTPEGVGPLVPGDRAECELLSAEGIALSRLEVTVG